MSNRKYDGLSDNLVNLHIQLLLSVPDAPSKRAQSFTDSSNLFNIGHFLLKSDFESVFEQISVSRFTKHLDPSNYVKTLQEILADQSESSSEPLEFASLVVFIGIASLNLFIQANFTGPAPAEDAVSRTLPETYQISDWSKPDVNRTLLRALVSDGEPAYDQLSFPHLLLLSETLFSFVGQTSSNPVCSIAKWWHARALVVHQSVLYANSSTLYDSIFDCLNLSTLTNLLDLPNVSSSANDLQIRFYCELCRAQLLYDYDIAAKSSLEKAKVLSGLYYNLTGFKGKRTKFQQKETSQLVFLAQSRSNPAQNKNETALVDIPLPSSIELNSDVLLEQPAYSIKVESIQDDSEESEADFVKNIDPNNQPALDDIDSAIVLLHLNLFKQTSPHNSPLNQEEMLAIINRIINNPSSSVNWTLFSRSLWERSLLEASSVKTVERGTLQMQSLVEELGQSGSSGTFIPAEISSDGAANVNTRLKYIHQVLPLPRWAMDAALAQRFMSLGAIKSALNIYERLQMWGELALCYAATDDSAEAQKIMSQQLELDPNNARYWSILGDITINPEYWEKAWQIGKYSPAKISLGKFYYNPPKSSKIERDLDLSIMHLNDSLKINPLNFDVWFLYGCAGLESEQYELSAEAFTRCVSIDETDSKSWSNLSTSLMKLGKKSEAFNALKRAVQASEERNWRIWGNYVTVAGQLGNWNEVLRGTREIIDIRGSKLGEGGLDIGVLEKLCQILVGTEFPQNDQAQLDFFQNSTIELFVKKVIPLITSEPRLWSLVSKIELWRKRPWAALEAYEKGFRIYAHIPSLETDEDVWNQAVEFCQELVDAYINLGPMPGKHGDGSVVSKDWKFKARSSVRMLLGRGKMSWQDKESYSRLEELKSDI